MPQDSGNVAPALEGLLGEDAAGLSASTVSRLCKEWETHRDRFRQRLLSFSRYAYLFMDGIHVQVRLGEDDRVCLLIVIGVREDGVKELLAVEAGIASRRELGRRVRDLERRGLSEPRLVVGDGALGAWAALRDVFPGAGEQRCWFHASGKVIDALQAAAAAREGISRDDRGPTARTRASARGVSRGVRAKYRKALAKLDRDWKPLTAFSDYPAEHWRHLRTTNPIESSFATVRRRICVTKGAGSKAAALAMAYKLLESAQERWRGFNGHELVADVLNDVKFKDGIKVTEDDTATQDERVAA